MSLSQSHLTDAFEIAHHQDNYQKTARIIPKFTARNAVRAVKTTGMLIVGTIRSNITSTWEGLLSSPLLVLSRLRLDSRGRSLRQGKVYHRSKFTLC